MYYSVLVQVSSRLTVTPQLRFFNFTVVNGMSVTLWCIVTAQPNATFGEIVRIQGNGDRIVLSRLNNTDGSTVFTIRYMFTAMFSADDRAIFQCLAENDIGSQDANITLTVQGELYLEYVPNSVIILNSSLCYSTINLSACISYMYMYSM